MIKMQINGNLDNFLKQIKEFEKMSKENENDEELKDDGESSK